ncbi:hypothetical protein SS1G_05683 [Sclerotinia sclerotiorum 1980 UF-70]|uniref:Chromo domain-containing protein n=1 Tax=Sclerotinia sclerotiorum (strain ATCC 18683 / 1980 / Ss-1) TaxID=665079 RepID=A7EK37_SCLS1|nr:hypothetical protein SS1G_05683 [Sclerotinia sclerotiorum 1980 UF-70]EDO03203.1 hypothetical protein SS1G_05683 [Sclerotinia sclerotiorum 1980 UF-70]
MEVYCLGFCSKTTIIQGPGYPEGVRLHPGGNRQVNQTKRPSDKLDHKKLGPFKIDKVVGPVNYRIKLLYTMNIHPIFHISLLEPAPSGAPDAPITEIEPVNPDVIYDVETILDCKYVRGKIKYLIKWLDYPHSENTWELKKDLSCPEKLEAFHQRYPDLPKKDPKNSERKRDHDESFQKPAHEGSVVAYLDEAISTKSLRARDPNAPAPE